MNVINLSVARGADGSKHLDIQIHGVIDGGWLDENPVNTADIIAELQRHLDAKTIGVRINSVGGSAFGGIALYNALKQHPADVTTYVEGLAASAASLVAMAGETKMGTGAMMMIHPPLTIAMGNASELRRTADVLDKVQAGLAAIYVEKTGKPLDEINAMITAETWMTAEEAIAAGFANGNGEAPALTEDAPADAPPADAAPTMTADAVVWNGVTFPLKALPQQQVVMAMAKPTATVSSAALPPGMLDPIASAVTPAPAPVAATPITRDVLAKQAPELLAALLAEGHAAGHAAGVAEERARLKAIDDLAIRGCDDLVAAAKYGEKPIDAPTLAVAVVKAGKQAGLEFLEARQREGTAAASVKSAPPAKTNEEAEMAAAKNIAEMANRRRGGTR